jgi:hypothetical protein
LDEIQDIVNDNALMSVNVELKLYDPLLTLFKNEEIIKIMKLYKDRLHIFDGIYYFLDKFESMKPKYDPTHLDTINSRVKSTGIKTTKFQISVNKMNVDIQLSDVGGQRNER